MFILCSVRALNIAEWGIRIDNSGITQVLQSGKIFILSSSVQPAATEGQRAESLRDEVEELLGFGESQIDTRSFEGLHVMGTFHVFVLTLPFPPSPTNSREER